MHHKAKEKIQGYLNYYLAFAGPVHSIINRSFLQPEIGKYYLVKLLECRRIKFRDPPIDQTLKVFTDAAPSRLCWIHALGAGTARMIQDKPIMFTETLAALIGIYSSMKAGSMNIILLTDNMATRAFNRRGAAFCFYIISITMYIFILYFYFVKSNN